MSLRRFAIATDSGLRDLRLLQKLPTPRDNSRATNESTTSNFWKLLDLGIKELKLAMTSKKMRSHSVTPTAISPNKCRYTADDRYLAHSIKWPMPKLWDTTCLLLSDARCLPLTCSAPKATPVKRSSGGVPSLDPMPIQRCRYR